MVHITIRLSIMIFHALSHKMIFAVFFCFEAVGWMAGRASCL